MKCVRARNTGTVHEVTTGLLCARVSAKIIMELRASANTASDDG